MSIRRAYNLAAASAIGNLDAVQRLLATPGTAVNSDGRFTPALIQASRNGHVDTVRALIAAGANLNRDYDNDTPLIAAARMGHLAVIQALLTAGANVNQSAFGNTPLRVAAAYGHTRIVETLLKAGANVTNPNAPGFTSLMLNEPRRYPDILRLFLRYGAVLPNPEEYRAIRNMAGVGRAWNVVRNVENLKNNTRRNRLASVLVERHGNTGLPNAILQEVGRKYLGGKSRRLRKRR
jgi:ankyrin repeat protein